MAGKKSKNIGSPSSSSSTSLVSQIFGSSGKSSTSDSSKLFNSVFATPPSMGEREHSSRSNVFGTNGKSRDPAGGSWNHSIADGVSRGGEGRGQSKLFGKEGSSIHQAQKIDPCPLSSSLYYGGQDICNHTNSNSRYTSSSYNNTYSNNGEDSPSGSPIDSRGDWWQGSLYY